MSPSGFQIMLIGNGLMAFGVFGGMYEGRDPEAKRQYFWKRWPFMKARQKLALVSWFVGWVVFIAGVLMTASVRY